MINKKDLKELMEIYGPSEVDTLKYKIRLARNAYVITDPYPEVTAWEQEQNLKSHMEKILEVTLNSSPKPDISVHKAYRDGMEFMWKLIEPLVK